MSITFPAPSFPAPSFPSPEFPLSPVADGQDSLNPYAPGNMYLGQAFQVNTEQVLQQRAIQQTRLMNAAQFAALQAAMGDAAPDTNPSEWSPQEAAQQTDRALAKLSTVNPELAQQLADMRSGQPSDDGDSFFDNLKQLAGDILHPGLMVAGKLLEVIARPAYIVPNIAFDIADGGEFNMGRDVAEALTGEMQHNWNSVMQELGWEADGLGGFTRAVLGLGMDILTDPLTWVYPAGAGLPAEQSMVIAARKAATEAPGILDLARKVEKYAGMSDADIAFALRTQFDARYTDILNEALRTGKPTSDLFDRFSAVMNDVWTAGEQELYAAMLETGERVGALARNRSLRLASDGLVISSRGGSTVTAGDVKLLFEKAVQKAGWKPYHSGEWAQGRAFASVLGGTRIKFAVPFTEFRYISPAANFGKLSKVMPGALIEDFVKFSAGQAGQQNLLHLIGLGEADWSHLSFWMQRGWTEFKDEFPDIAAKVGTKYRGMASSLWSASERVGGITAAMSPHAMASRGGLAHYVYGSRASVEAKQLNLTFTRNAIKRALGSREGEQILADTTRVFVSDEALNDPDILRFFEIPDRLDAASGTALEASYRQAYPEFAELEVAASLGEDLTAEQFTALAKHRSRVSIWAQAADKFTDEQKALLARYKVVWGVVKDEGGKFGARVGHVGYNFDEAPGIRYDQVEQWQQGKGTPHPVSRETFWLHEVRGQEAQELKNFGITEGHVTYGDDGVGYVVSTKRISPDDAEVRIRGGELIKLDETGNARLARGMDPGRSVLDARKEIHDGLVEELTKLRAARARAAQGRNAEAMERVRAEVGDDLLSAEELLEKETYLITEEMKAYHPEASGTYRVREDGTIDATIWNRDDIIMVGDDLPYVEQDLGYVHRLINEKATTWVHGQVPKDEAQILLTDTVLKAEIGRETVGMTIDEANDYARRKILAKFPQGDPSTLPEFVFEQFLPTVHERYLQDMGRDIEARVFGRYAERMRDVARIVPQSFAKPPRGQEFEWAMSKGMHNAVLKADKKAYEAVMVNIKKAALYTDRQHKHFAWLADKFGEYNFTVDDPMRQVIGPSERTIENVVRVHLRREDAYRIADLADETLQQSLDDLAAEEAEYIRLRSLFADEYAAAQGNPAQAAKAQAEIDRIDAQLAKSVGADKDAIEALQWQKNVAQAKLAAAQPNRMAKLIKDMEMFSPDNPLLQLGWASDVVAEDLGSGRWRYRMWLGDDSFTGGGIAKAYGKGKAALPKPVTFEGFPLGSHEGTVLRTTDEAASVIASTAKGTYYGVEVVRTADGYTALPLDNWGQWRKAMDRAEFDPTRRVYTSADLQRYDGVLFGDDSIRVFEHARERSVTSALADGEAIFDAKAEKHLLYQSHKTGAVVTRQGTFVKEFGGKRIFAPSERAARHAELMDQAARNAEARRAIDEGTRFIAPEVPEVRGPAPSPLLRVRNLEEEAMPQPGVAAAPVETQASSVAETAAPPPKAPPKPRGTKAKQASLKTLENRYVDATAKMVRLQREADELAGKAALADDVALTQEAEVAEEAALSAQRAFEAAEDAYVAAGGTPVRAPSQAHHIEKVRGKFQLIEDDSGAVIMEFKTYAEAQHKLQSMDDLFYKKMRPRPRVTEQPEVAATAQETQLRFEGAGGLPEDSVVVGYDANFEYAMKNTGPQMGLVYKRAEPGGAWVEEGTASSIKAARERGAYSDLRSMTELEATVAAPTPAKAAVKEVAKAEPPLQRTLADLTEEQRALGVAWKEAQAKARQAEDILVNQSADVSAKAEKTADAKAAAAQAEEEAAKKAYIEAGGIDPGTLLPSQRVTIDKYPNPLDPQKAQWEVHDAITDDHLHTYSTREMAEEAVRKTDETALRRSRKLTERYPDRMAQIEEERAHAIVQEEIPEVVFTPAQEKQLALARAETIKAEASGDEAAALAANNREFAMRARFEGQQTGKVKPPKEAPPPPEVPTTFEQAPKGVLAESEHTVYKDGVAVGQVYKHTENGKAQWYVRGGTGAGYRTRKAAAASIEAPVLPPRVAVEGFRVVGGDKTFGDFAHIAGVDETAAFERIQAEGRFMGWADPMSLDDPVTQAYMSGAEELPGYYDGLVFKRSDDTRGVWLKDEGVITDQREFVRPQGHVQQPGATERLEFAAQQGAKARQTAQKAAARQAKVLARLARLEEKARTEFAKATNSMNKTLAEAKGIKANMKVAFTPVPTAGDLGYLTRLRVPGLEGFAAPSYIAAEWHAVLDSHGPGYLSKAWRQFVLGPWKRWATYRWVGFHVRNFFGAWFNNWLGGVTIPDYMFSLRVNRDRYSATKVSLEEFERYGMKYVWGEDMRGVLTYEDVRSHLAAQGTAASGNVKAVMDAANNTDLLTDALAQSKRHPSRAHQLLTQLDGKLRDIGSNVEDFHRAAAWARGMAVTDGDTYGARAFTMLRHGDYADLTPQEDHIRDLVPFYKWMRTNIPYQIRMLAEEPAKLALVTDKLKNFAYDVAGYDRQAAETQMPDYMKQTLSIPVPSWVPFVGSKGPDAIKYAMFDLPYNDLYNGLNDYISSALPIGRNLIESYGFKTQAFTGRPLGDGKMVKLSGAFNLPVIRDLLAATPWAMKGPDGGIYMPDTIENVLTAFPIYSKFRNFAEADEARVEQRLGGLFSMIAGMQIREADFIQAELDFFYNEVEPLLTTYRDMGVVFPNAQDFVSASDTLVQPELAAFSPTNNVYTKGVAA